MKKWPEAGIIWCEREQTACAYCSITDGSCTAGRCNIRDPEYIERKKEIEETRKHNDQNRQKEKDIEKKDPPAPIRNDSTKAINQIEDKDYIAYLKKDEYHGDVLLVGINYNAESKKHECKIEHLQMQIPSNA